MIPKMDRDWTEHKKGRLDLTKTEKGCTIAPSSKSDGLLFGSSRRAHWIYAPKRQGIPRMGRGTLEVPDGTGSRRASIYHAVH